jgi:hypothetical protein
VDDARSGLTVDVSNRELAEERCMVRSHDRMQRPAALSRLRRPYRRASLDDLSKEVVRIGAARRGGVLHCDGLRFVGSRRSSEEADESQRRRRPATVPADPFSSDVQCSSTVGRRSDATGRRMVRVSMRTHDGSIERAARET